MLLQENWWCNCIFWGYVKDKVYVPPLPRDLKEVRERITNAVASISMDDLVKVCDELEYSRVTHGAHIENL
jgi:hypothetical protein